jgi:hypothetical protein
MIGPSTALSFLGEPSLSPINGGFKVVIPESENLPDTRIENRIVCPAPIATK